MYKKKTTLQGRFQPSNGSKQVCTVEGKIVIVYILKVLMSFKTKNIPIILSVTEKKYQATSKFIKKWKHQFMK